MTHTKNITKFAHMGLVAICIGLGIILFTELNTNYSHNETITASKADMTDEITTPDVIEDFPPLTDYQATIDRPLFMHDRQPYVYEEPKEEAKQTKVKKKTIQKKTPQQLVLTATIITPDRQVAIIRTGKSKESLHIAIGEIIDNWTLEEVHAQHIVLKDGEKTEKLELEIQGSPKTSNRRTKRESSQRAKRQKAEAKDNNKTENGVDPEETP